MFHHEMTPKKHEIQKKRLGLVSFRVSRRYISSDFGFSDVRLASFFCELPPGRFPFIDPLASVPLIAA